MTSFLSHSARVMWAPASKIARAPWTAPWTAPWMLPASRQPAGPRSRRPPQIICFVMHKMRDPHPAPASRGPPGHAGWTEPSRTAPLGSRCAAWTGHPCLQRHAMEQQRSAGSEKAQRVESAGWQGLARGNSPRSASHGRPLLYLCLSLGIRTPARGSRTSPRRPGAS